MRRQSGVRLRVAHVVAEAGSVGAEALQQDAGVAEVTEHEAGLTEVAQAATEPEPVVALDYTRDIGAVAGQKLRETRTMNRRLRFHPPSVARAEPRTPSGVRPAHRASVLSGFPSVISVSIHPSLWLRRQPR